MMASHPENSVKHSYCDSVLDSRPPILSSLVAIKLVQIRYSIVPRTMQTSNEFPIVYDTTTH
jgi:hypothetical protein